MKLIKNLFNSKRPKKKKLFLLSFSQTNWPWLFFYLLGIQKNSVKHCACDDPPQSTNSVDYHTIIPRDSRGLI